MKIELADGRSLLKLNSTVVPGGLRHAGIVEKRESGKVCRARGVWDRGMNEKKIRGIGLQEEEKSAIGKNLT